jgi:hypothetical protein
MAGLVPTTPINEARRSSQVEMPLCRMIGVAGTSPAMTSVKALTLT